MIGYSWEAVNWAPRSVLACIGKIGVVKAAIAAAVRGAGLGGTIAVEAGAIWFFVLTFVSGLSVL